MEMVVKPSGKALPTAIIVKPKYVVLKFVYIPMTVNKSTNKPQHILVHKIPLKILKSVK